jgi:hypothetical protein
VKQRFFTESHNKAIEEFANTWFVEEGELHTSAVQYESLFQISGESSTASNLINIKPYIQMQNH